jgi:transcriptional regulator with PAS, ATPase and Fis domain
MPPLRSRPDDIRFWSSKLIDSFNTEFGSVLSATPAAALLQRYGWPGNVRELRNVIERAMLLSDGDRLDARDYEHDWDGQHRRRIRAAPTVSTSRSWNAAFSCRRFGAVGQPDQDRHATRIESGSDSLPDRKFGLTTTQ